MIKYFKNKKKEKLAKEKLAQQQTSDKERHNDLPEHVNAGNEQVENVQTITQENRPQSSQHGQQPLTQTNNKEESQGQQGNDSEKQQHTDQAVQPSVDSVSVDNNAITKEHPVLVIETPIDNGTKSNSVLDVQLEKSNKNFGKKMKQLFTFKKKIDEELYEDMETTLLMADVGAAATMDMMEKVRKSIKRKNASDADAVYDALKIQLGELAAKVEQPLNISTEKQPFVILVVGVNGVGKTTTIAKLAKKYKSEGKKVMLAAGDTFRAAAVEQLKTWGQREDIPVMAQNTGADSASVIFDAMTSAKSKGIDVLIADTAGRLHTQANLMQELEKISRVMKKNDASAPHETLIVVDGGTGQNAISQVREFNKAHKLTGIVITKLDGTAKGGVLFNLAAEFGIPVRFIGVGEQSSDLKPYSAKEFVDALIS